MGITAIRYVVTVYLDPVCVIPTNIIINLSSIDIVTGSNHHLITITTRLDHKL